MWIRSDVYLPDVYLCVIMYISASRPIGVIYRFHPIGRLGGDAGALASGGRGPAESASDPRYGSMNLFMHQDRPANAG